MALPCMASFLIFTQLFLLQPYYSRSANQFCAPSSCGKISQIRHPFRLSDDPEHCGNKTYELTCQNNVTVLELFPGLYYHVESINYNNFTIRLVDSSVQQSDCSTIPRYSLYQGNFTDTRCGRYYIGHHMDPYEASQLRCGGYDSGGVIPYEAFQIREHGHEAWAINMFWHIIYLNCSNPVTDDLQYIDTAPCINMEQSSGHIYAIAEHLLVGSVKADCHVRQVAVSSLQGALDILGEKPTKKNNSYHEIHAGLSYGFEVSWMNRACEDRCGLQRCVFVHDFEINCGLYWCYRYLGRIHCGRWAKLSFHAYAFFLGIHDGLLTLTQTGIVRQSYLEYKLGMVGGRYVVPYMGIRLLLVSILLVARLIWKCRRRHLSGYENIEDFLQHNNINPIRYSYREIKTMTNSFKDKLGDGGYSSVYKGRLRSGPFVAIKMLDKIKANGQEFISEVATIGRIYHVNVVQLIGFCVEGSKRALVYEFMPNGSLDKYVFSKEGTLPLSYDKIYNIALGVARGIAYLHHGCHMQILHFDIKPHNILLDENFIPKISDFGLAKLYPIDHNIVTLTTARGTIGYIAPELFYKNIGGVSFKADVYSFGMLLMEIVGRRKNLDLHAEHSSQLYFPSWIYDQFNENKDIKMEDMTEQEKNVTKKMFIVALWCIQLKPSDRPSMSRVIEMLEGTIKNLDMPPKPSLCPQDLEDSKVNQTMINGSSSSATCF